VEGGRKERAQKPVSGGSSARVREKKVAEFPRVAHPVYKGGGGEEGEILDDRLSMCERREGKKRGSNQVS